MLLSEYCEEVAFFLDPELPQPGPDELEDFFDEQADPKAVAQQWMEYLEMHWHDMLGL